jgi:uncharacterized protein YndB with AHSA1/START domain
MTTDDTLLLIRRVFDAPPAAVFDAWTKAEDWQSWIGPEGVDCGVELLDARAGGRFRLTMRIAPDRTATVVGEFRIVERPDRLVFTWGLEGDAGKVSLITLTFRESAGKTDFTLRQEGLGGVENRNMHEQGWQSTFRKLDRHLAGARNVKGGAHT